MTYLTEEERAARKQLAQQKYRKKEEVKIRKSFNDCNSRRRRLGLSVFTFEEWVEWTKYKHAPKGSLIYKYKQFIQSRKKRGEPLLSFKDYLELIYKREVKKSLDDEEKRLLRNQKARDFYHNNEEARAKKLSQCKNYRKRTPEQQREYARRSYENYKKKIEEMSDFEREQYLNKRRKSCKTCLENLTEEKRKKYRDAKRRYVAKMTPEEKANFYKKKHAWYKEYLKRHPEKRYEALVRQRKKKGLLKKDTLEDYLQKLKDKSDKTGKYNEDLSFLNEKHPFKKELLEPEEFKRRNFIMQKIRCVIKSLGLPTEVLSNYRKGVYTMQQLKSFLDMYNNKDWKK